MLQPKPHGAIADVPLFQRMLRVLMVCQEHLERQLDGTARVLAAVSPPPDLPRSALSGPSIDRDVERSR
ncbi:hypothetical protein HMPREF9946_02044 [Acetobacteraceae bacterium AT-5844]|nr:hypothetical protein HMPREF9946_02044 [Acetobacteraceae bacterium AT-5844]